MKIGYAFHGYMGDVRMRNWQPFSSPDSSLLYAFTILHGFQEAGHETWRLFPDRDAEFVAKEKERAFQAFSQKKRYEAYRRAKQAYHQITSENIQCHWPDVDIVLLEYRMKTWRNILPIDHPDFDPDLVLQDRLIEWYTERNVPIICLDLDYAITNEHAYVFHAILEPGFSRGEAYHFDFPFYMEDMMQFETEVSSRKIVYVGNRYDRDDAFDMYFGKWSEQFSFHVYGNWLEGGRDSQQRWPHIHFLPRAQPYQIRAAYKHAASVPLLLKNEYNTHGFMTVRPIEALLFGTIPLLPTAFSASSKQYMFPRIADQDEMIAYTEMFLYKKDKDAMRKHLIESIDFHDIRFFLQKVESVL